jgi:hypothetical protein
MRVLFESPNHPTTCSIHLAPAATLLRVLEADTLEAVFE